MVDALPWLTLYVGHRGDRNSQPAETLALSDTFRGSLQNINKFKLLGVLAGQSGQPLTIPEDMHVHFTYKVLGGTVEMLAPG
jgi:hypothetical protein